MESTIYENQFYFITGVSIIIYFVIFNIFGSRNRKQLDSIVKNHKDWVRSKDLKYAKRGKELRKLNKKLKYQFLFMNLIVFSVQLVFAIILFNVTDILKISIPFVIFSALIIILAWIKNGSVISGVKHYPATSYTSV